MITFGFKSKIGGWTRVVLALALGGVMVAWPGSSLRFVVMALAAGLIVSGLVSIVYGVAVGEKAAMSLLIVNAIVDMVLGAVVFCFPEAVAGILMWVFGFFLVIIGVYQLVALASAFAFLPGMRFFAFLLPSLCIIGGVLVLLNPFGSAAMLTMTAGIGILIYGISELCSMLQMRKAQKTYMEGFDAGDGMSVPDVDYEMVDDQSIEEE